MTFKRCPDSVWKLLFLENESSHIFLDGGAKAPDPVFLSLWRVINNMTFDIWENKNKKH